MMNVRVATVVAATCMAMTLMMPDGAVGQFQFQFEDMFGQQGGGGQGGGDGRQEPVELEKGYRCSETDDIVDHPRQCPCPGYKMVKCKLDDWYACIPSGGKCAEGKYATYGAADEGIDEEEEEE